MTEDFITEVRDEVDKTLDKLLPAAEVAPANLHEAIRWSIFAGGKRVRPMIVIASGETFGASRAHLLPIAAAIEMVHTYSLIHDDLPAMDNDDLRRGKAACHKQFGEATAILAGDVLQTLAFKTIADDEALAAETRLRIVSLLADAAGTPTGMVSGQQLDLAAEGKTLAIAEIEHIHRQKTGALITASALAGAIIGGAGEDELAAIREYGANLGLLFQITDDLLDATTATEKLGKTAGKDAASEKATYTGHYGIVQTREQANNILETACSALSPINTDVSRLRDLANLIAGRTR